MHCLQNFASNEVLSNHKKQCLLISGTQAVNYESETIKFINHNKQILIPFKIYADTECFLKRTNSHEDEYRIKYQEHIANVIGAKLSCTDDRFTLPFIIFKGDDSINKFINWIFEQKEWINRAIREYFNKDLIITNEDEEIYQNSQLCWICKEELNMDKVRDYCHITSKFRGASHNKCNLNLRLPKKVPIIFHNLQGYD